MLRKFDEEELGRVLDDAGNRRYWIGAARLQISRRSCSRAASDYYLDLLGEAYLTVLRQNEEEGLPENVFTLVCHQINRLADTATWKRMFKDRCRDSSYDALEEVPSAVASGISGDESIHTSHSGEDTEIALALYECIAALSTLDQKITVAYYFADAKLKDLTSLLGGQGTTSAFKRKQAILKRLTNCLDGKGFKVESTCL